MDTVRNYLGGITNALVGGKENFEMKSTASVTIIVVYAAFLIAYSTGAAVLSYNYNLSVGTSSTAMVVYMILAFLFSALYYPYYAFALSPSGRPMVHKGGRR